MGNRNTPITTGRHLARVAIFTIVVTLLSGCAQTSDWIKEHLSSNADDIGILGAPDAENYLKELGRLAGGDPAIQAEILADANSVALLTPGPSANLRLGLVLSIPGHPGFDPDKAQTLLRDVLAETQMLTPSEIHLATIQLNNVERLIVNVERLSIAEAESSRLSKTESQEQATSRRLAAAEADNQRMRGELEEAEEKLEAITSIERSIREQE